MKKDKIIIAIYVDNQYGVLSRVTAMFTRRGFNIDSLTVGETESPAYSRITITLSAAKTDKDQVVSQLRKLYNVKKVVVLSNEECIKRELMLIKVRNSDETRERILETANIFRGKIIDLGEEAISIEVTGDSSKIDGFIQNVKSFGIIEMCRTASLVKFLKIADEGTQSQNDLIEAYAEFVNAVYQLRPDADFSGALWDALKTDDNAYLNFKKTNAMRRRTGEEELKISRMMELSAERELDILTKIGNTSYINLQSMLYFDGYIAQFKSTGIDLKERYLALLASLEA